MTSTEEAQRIAYHQKILFKCEKWPRTCWMTLYAHSSGPPLFWPSPAEPACSQTQRSSCICRCSGTERRRSEPETGRPQSAGSVAWSPPFWTPPQSPPLPESSTGTIRPIKVKIRYSISCNLLIRTEHMQLLNIT